MLKKNKRSLILSSLLIVLPVIVGLIFWNRLPELMTTHWNWQGTADGKSSKAFTVIGLPLFILAMHWFCVLCTGLDPKNKGQNGKVFGMVLWICPVVSLFVGGVVYADAFGVSFDIDRVFLIMIGAMFVIFGNYMPKCRQNSTIGIKVKWALQDEANWNATHRLGGRLWVIGGLLLLVCAFLPEMLIPWLLIVILAVLAVVPIVFSYAFYKKHQW